MEDHSGESRLAGPDGPVRCTVLDPCRAPLSFDARRLHCVLPCQGSRVVVLGFTPGGVFRPDAAQVQQLVSLGFPVPGELQPHHTTAPVNNATKACARAASSCAGAKELTIGVYRDEAEFVRAAVKAGHPRSLHASLPCHISRCVDLLSKAPANEVVSARAAWFGKWTARANAIAADPCPHWSVEGEHRRKIMSRKRLQLLDEIIRTEGYEDVLLPRDMLKGFDLTGRVPTSGVLPGKISPATMHADDLMMHSGRNREAVRESLGPSGDPEQDRALWAKTLEEVEKGWLIGPLEWDDLREGDIVSHRFPVKQGAKIRPIDDYSRSGVNACVTTLEQPTVDTVDVASAMFLRLSCGLEKAKLPGGVLGRSFDLTAAYRQLCVSEGSKQFAIIAVFDPVQNRSRVFRQISLPFGSRASVNGFIRCSRCIQWIANHCLLIPTTSYYDDFIVASPHALAANTETCMGMLFDLLGWQYDVSGPKADTFAQRVLALGVSFDLSASPRSVILVDNTEKRKGDLDALVSGALKEGTLQHKEALALKGKLAFAEAQVLGKAGQYALKALSNHIFHRPFCAALQPELVSCLKFMRVRLKEGKPRALCRSLGACWFVFTDASFSSDFEGGLGGVLVSPTGSVCSWFSLMLCEADVLPLLPPEAATGIGELETLAVLLGFRFWCKHLKGAECVAYIDNEGARYALMKGCSRSMQITKLCHLFATACEADTTITWFARVPSASNIADHPSRGVSNSMLPPRMQLGPALVRSTFSLLRSSLLQLQ